MHPTRFFFFKRCRVRVRRDNDLSHAYAAHFAPNSACASVHVVTFLIHPRRIQRGSTAEERACLSLPPSSGNRLRPITTTTTTRRDWTWHSSHVFPSRLQFFRALPRFNSAVSNAARENRMTRIAAALRRDAVDTRGTVNRD